MVFNKKYFTNRHIGTQKLSIASVLGNVITFGEKNLPTSLFYLQKKVFDLQYFT